jgi:hypothetical protein
MLKYLFHELKIHLDFLLLRTMNVINFLVIILSDKSSILALGLGVIFHLVHLSIGSMFDLWIFLYVLYRCNHLNWTLIVVLVLLNVEASMKYSTKYTMELYRYNVKDHMC